MSIHQWPVFVSFSTSNTAFKEVLKQIESTPECGALPMISFLILPMQRVTRLPLLMDVRSMHIQTQFFFYRIWICLQRRNMSLPPSASEVVFFLCTFMQTICQKTTKQTTEYYAARWALKAISKVWQSVLSLYLLQKLHLCSNTFTFSRLMGYSERLKSLLFLFFVFSF